MTECRTFEITLVRATDLPNIRNFGRTKVYAVVSLNGEPETTKTTNVDFEGELNPIWNFPFHYTIKDSSAREPGLELLVKLYCRRTLGDGLLGHVRISVNNLFQRGIRAENEIVYIVAGTRIGKLYILYRFGDIFLVAKPSVWRKALWNAAAAVLRGTWFVVTGLVFCVHRRRRAYGIPRIL